MTKNNAPANYVTLRKIAKWIFYVSAVPWVILALALDDPITRILSISIAIICVAFALGQRRILRHGLTPFQQKIAGKQPASRTPAYLSTSATPLQPSPASLLPGKPLPGATASIEIVGEKYYQDSFRAFLPAAQLQSDGGVEIRTSALLVCEPDNPYDELAVGVWVNGYQVGHLPREDAQKVNFGLTSIEDAGQHVEVPARVWARENNGIGARVTIKMPHSLL